MDSYVNQTQYSNGLEIRNDFTIQLRTCRTVTFLCIFIIISNDLEKKNALVCFGAKCDLHMIAVKLIAVLFLNTFKMNKLIYIKMKQS
jgi:hypothetical protein